MPVLTKRAFISGLALGTACAGLGSPAFAAFDPEAGPWTRYQVTTRMSLATPRDRAEAWIPLPSVSNSSWVRPLGNDWQGNGAVARSVSAEGAGMLHVIWDKGTAAPSITVRSRFATRDRSVDWNAPGPARPLSASERQRFTAATTYIPVTGEIKQISDHITAGAGSEREKVAAIYNWVVCNTYRNGKVLGCGTGNVAAMLKFANFGGKCADINGLFVGLVRSAGIPARDIYGIRVGPSAFGYHSLGANSPDITKAQHCRAEVYLEDYGWTAMDPADVRKVMLEEVKGGLPLGNPRVAAVRRALFGSWEDNWMPYNHASDVVLPGGGGRSLPFLMYPQAEIDGAWLDPLQPKTVAYDIRAEKI